MNESDIESESEVSEISGLNSILSIFENIHFLVILTDCRGSQFSELSYPIILRKLSLAWLWKRTSYNNWGTPEELRYVLDEILKRETNISNKYQRAYLHLGMKSPFWYQYDKVFSPLVPFLDEERYWKRARPWNNIVSLYLFQHVRLALRAKSFPLEDRTKHVYSDINILPSTVPPVTILVIHPFEKPTRDQLTRMVVLLANARAGELSSIFAPKLMTHAAFFLLEASTVPFSSYFTPANLKVVIQNIRLIQLCPRKFQVHLIFVNLSVTRGSLNDMAEISRTISSSSLCHPNASLNNILVSIDSETEELASIFLNRLQNCETFSDLRGSYYTRGIAKKYGSVWMSILGNYSYEITYLNNRFCDNGKVVNEIGFSPNMIDLRLYIKQTFLQPVASATIYPAVLVTMHSDLRLVICGYKELGKLPFLEFFTAFQANVWFTLIISICTVILILQGIPVTTYNPSMMQSTLAMLKLFLEQGDPFPMSVMRNPNSRPISVTLLLMAIILSNAYKNTNVYNMIIPGSVVPYHYLEELVSDNFSIHTRSLGASLQRLRTSPGDCSTATRTRFISVVQKRHRSQYIIDVDEECHLEHMTYKSEVSSLHDRIKYNELQFLNTTLLNLLPEVTSVIQLKESLFVNFAKLIIGVFSDFNYENDYQYWFRQTEIKYLWKSLKRCRKVALLFPSQVGYEEVKRWEKHGFTNVYQGAEAFYERNLAFTLKGLVPQYLVQRLKNAETCGLWKRWQNLLEKKVLPRSKRKTEELSTPSMDGNVVVIFLLLVAGLGASLKCFVLEEMWYNYKKFCKYNP